ncbi:MAG TPA: ChbG/HpnK family deacetylase [Candidatus Methylacidiphilales bacterium]
MAKNIFFIADDLGLSSETNEAMLAAHKEGALHGAALMMGQPGTDEAVALAKATPGFQVGIHLHFTDSVPLTRAAWPWAPTPAAAGWSIGLLPSARKLMEEELAAQWAAYEATGLPCRFVTTHHHLHVHPFIYEALCRTIPPEKAGWLRFGAVRLFGGDPLGLRIGMACGNLANVRRRRRSPYRCSDTLWGVGRTFGMKADEVEAAIAGLPADGLHEFIFHPRRVGDNDTTELLKLKRLNLSTPE